MKETNHSDSHVSPTQILHNRNFRIVKMSKGQDIQWLSLRLIHSGYKVLQVASCSLKYYIYIYAEKLLFIAITIRSQSQQVNMTPNSVRSRMRSFQDFANNFLSWKTTPPPLLSKVCFYCEVQWLQIYHLINVTRTKLRRIMK